MKTSNKLLPCVKCGKPARIIPGKGLGLYGTSWYVSCSDPGCMQPGMVLRDREQAIAAWNRRAEIKEGRK